MKNNLHEFIPPYAYFITFTTYGTWLHGDPRSSVDLKNNLIGTPKIQPNKKRRQYNYNKMRYEPFLLDDAKRKVVLKAINDVALHYNWYLLAAHIRTNHVHVLLRAEKTPEHVMQKLKTYATFSLNSFLPKSMHQQYWTRHGSTRYVQTERGAYPVMRYIIEEQGEKMSYYCPSWFNEITSYDFY